MILEVKSKKFANPMIDFTEIRLFETNNQFSKKNLILVSLMALRNHRAVFIAEHSPLPKFSRKSKLSQKNFAKSSRKLCALIQA
ncbi:hypothetical protein CMU11_08280 [Elizabethkingia anophelis]|nr:hypothetical protein [Elizabethkingia anophelis]MDV3946410.1 hypothetical protein [Elizabethkingia anophelis]